MKRSTLAVAAGVVMLMAATAGANIGNYYYSATASNFPGTIEGFISASTSAAATPDSLDILSNWMWLGTYPGSATVDSQVDSTSRGAMSPFQLNSTFSFSGLSGGSYVVWVGGRAFSHLPGSGYASAETTSYYYGFFDVDPAVAIPAASHVGLLVLGLLLATTGVILLRRA
jgi:hypothetical protein